jgi:hypothetical protein
MLNWVKMIKTGLVQLIRSKWVLMVTLQLMPGIVPG